MAGDEDQERRKDTREIYERLRQIELTQERTNALLESNLSAHALRLDKVEQANDKADRALHGTNGHEGLISWRKRTEGHIRWFVGWITALFALVIERFVEQFFH